MFRLRQRDDPPQVREDSGRLATALLDGALGHPLERVGDLLGLAVEVAAPRRPIAPGGRVRKSPREPQGILLHQVAEAFATLRPAAPREKIHEREIGQEVHRLGDLSDLRLVDGDG